MHEWLNPEYSDPSTLASEYASAQPFPHMSLSDILIEEKAVALRDALATERFERKEADLFSFFQTGDLLDSDNPVIKEFIHFLTSREFVDWMKTVTREQLSGNIDAMAVVYADTDHLLCHDDQLEGRKIAFVLNLCEPFEEEDGGALALLDSTDKGRPREVVARLAPSWNTLNFFTVSPTSHHMVEEVLADKERLSWTGWFHG